MEWDPTDNAEVVNVAWPEASSVPVARTEPPSSKRTVPVGVPEPEPAALTVAVKVTGWPETEGLEEELTVVVLLSWLTTWVNVEDVLVVKSVSPL